MKTVDDFLMKIGMHPDMTDISAVCQSFMREMELGLAGEDSSLPMIPSFISANGSPEDDKPIIAIDAGGTNLRIGLVSFQQGKPVVLQQESMPMPGSRGEISAAEFFDLIAQCLLPLTEKSSSIAFCFSYPAEIFPDHDGKIICLNKEVRVRCAEGLLLGQELIKALRARGAENSFDFILLNDTAAGLMGGIAALGLKDYDGIAGLVLGTGSNTCYMERGENIKKLANPSDMIINCESGIFNKLVRGESDIMTDMASDIPGDHQLEKMISGVYHGTVITNTLRLAAGEGLLSASFGSIREPFTPKQLDDFLLGQDNPVAALCGDGDAETVKTIIDRSYERSAKLVCANIAALCLHCDGGKTQERPFYVVAEGSSFHKSLLFRDKLNKYMDGFVKNTLGRHVSIVRAENSTLAGATLAALLN